MVVRDLDQAMERYVGEFGVGPWSVYTFSPDWIKDVNVRGEPQGYTMRLAIAYVGSMMYQLLEPVEGPNAYKEFLDERGEGLHHLGYFVEDLDAAIRYMEGKGYTLLQSGRGIGTVGDGGYAYFDTEGPLGIVEAIELPGQMQDPERIYPAQ
jgi:catechol 2,3-dioxygenase-like lactoylglutathione lyase family enzyme